MALYISVYKGKTKKYIYIYMLLLDNAYVYICIYISMCCMYICIIVICYKLSYSPFSHFFIKNTKNIKNIFLFLKCNHILNITFSELRNREPYDVYKKKKFNMHRVRLFFWPCLWRIFFYIYLTFNLIF